MNINNFTNNHNIPLCNISYVMFNENNLILKNKQKDEIQNNYNNGTFRVNFEC